MSYNNSFTSSFVRVLLKKNSKSFGALDQSETLAQLKYRFSWDIVVKYKYLYLSTYDFRRVARLGLRRKGPPVRLLGIRGRQKAYSSTSTSTEVYYRSTSGSYK
jgi:hypothetical protein